MKQNILGMDEEEEQGQTDIEFDSRTLGTGSMCASPTQVHCRTSTSDSIGRELAFDPCAAPLLSSYHSFSHQSKSAMSPGLTHPGSFA